MNDEVKPLTVEIDGVTIYATEPSIYFYGGATDPFRSKGIYGYTVTRLDAGSVDNILLDERDKAIVIALLEHSLKRLREGES